MSTHLLDVKRLTRAFGGLVAANNVDFFVREREVVGLIGPNGAGKTTVFNVIAGSLKPDAGSVHLRGVDCTGLPTHRMAVRGVARTFQITSLFPTMSVADNVKIGTHRRMRSTWLGSILMNGLYRREETAVAAKTDEILEFLEMAHQREVIAQVLPYGDQRKLEIAVALASEPSLLLLDEPAAGMNPDEARRLTQIIGRIRDSGISVLLVEHHMRVVMGICDRIVVLNQGLKIAEGLPSEVANDPTVISVYLGREAVDAKA